jgi:quinol monooxygenase YgiN
MEHVIVLIHYRAKPGAEEAALRELSALVATVVSTEPACHGIEVSRDLDDPARILLYEKWADKESYVGEHMRTPHIQSFIRRAGGLFVGPPDITFWGPAGGGENS